VIYLPPFQAEIWNLMRGKIGVKLRRRRRRRRRPQDSAYR